MRLADAIPDPRTRQWLRSLYGVNPDLAGELAWSLSQGELIDMGGLFAPCPDHPGCNIANHSCEECGHPQAPRETCWQMTSRWETTEPQTVNPSQLALDSHAQLELC